MPDQPVDIDRQLVERLSGGDTRAMDVLYHRYAQPLFAYLTNITDNRDLAEEILQDTFVAAWNAAARFEDRSTVKTWLFSIARRQASNSLRRKSLPLTDESKLHAFHDSAPSPEQSLIARANQEEVGEAMSALSPLHREVLNLTFVEGLSYEEIAEVLAVPVGTIKSRLSNARRALRAALERSEEVQ